MPMYDTQHETVLNALQLVLRPIVKLLFRYGIGYNQFAEVVKTVFVDVGGSEFGIRGRPTNISRVAVMTGLTRKEVRRLRTKLETGDSSVTVKSTPITEILRRWNSEDEFLDSAGRPAILPFVGEQKSFSSLVKRFGGDVPAGAMRTELRRVGSISENSDGDLSISKRSFWPADETEKLEAAMVHHVYPLLCNVVHNTDPANSENGRAQLAAYSLNISKEDRPRLKRMCSDRLNDMAESFDDLFMAFESRDESDKGANKAPVTVGMYYFEETDEKVTYNW